MLEASRVVKIKPVLVMKKPDKIVQFNANLARKSERDLSRLAGREKTIERSLRTRSACDLDIGKELLEIQSEKDFPDDTFEGYIKRRWEKERQWGYKLIDAYKIASALPENVPHGVQNTRQALALKASPPEERAAVVESVASKGPVTAKAITQEIKERKTEPKAKPVEAEFSEVRKDEIFDRNGVPVPDSIRTTWRTTQADFDDMQLHAHALLDMWPANLCGPLPEAVKKALSSILLTLDIQVCPACKGQTCKQCGRRGVVSGRPFIK